MDIYNFYNKFHKRAKLQNKIINKNNFTYRLILPELESVLGKKTNLNILDYGCGVGTLSFYLASKDNNIVGVDISDLAINTAKENARLLNLQKKTLFFNLKQGLRKIRSQKFDLILCIEVLEHIANEQNVISLLVSRLKPKGIIILSSPSVNAPLYKLGLTKKFDKRVGHLRRYSLSSFQNKVVKSGASIVKVIKIEGIIRNSLYIIPFLGRFIRLIKGPLVELVTFVDNLTIPILGESDIFIIARKK